MTKGEEEEEEEKVTKV
ncbi:hypothetical protein AZE42_12685 [Rhizopogon vesiculosus]|uniref:Uncharacterized protein n=1 Tax=Rhizopogon vesiculosus TaxID=180088 RepID=A0A1J8RD29_9AGAM|nr:hypothetical protein AZE42_12685 [Rhizopogon vesiculosus]